MLNLHKNGQEAEDNSTLFLIQFLLWIFFAFVPITNYSVIMNFITFSWVCNFPISFKIWFNTSINLQLMRTNLLSSSPFFGFPSFFLFLLCVEIVTNVFSMPNEDTYFILFDYSVVYDILLFFSSISFKTPFCIRSSLYTGSVNIKL